MTAARMVRMWIVKRKVGGSILDSVNYSFGTIKDCGLVIVNKKVKLNHKHSSKFFRVHKVIRVKDFAGIWEHTKVR
jgi:hypothetical protein